MLKDAGLTSAPGWLKPPVREGVSTHDIQPDDGVGRNADRPSGSGGQCVAPRRLDPRRPRRTPTGTTRRRPRRPDRPLCPTAIVGVKMTYRPGPAGRFRAPIPRITGTSRSAGRPSGKTPGGLPIFYHLTKAFRGRTPACPAHQSASSPCLDLDGRLALGLEQCLDRARGVLTQRRPRSCRHAMRCGVSSTQQRPLC